MCTESGILFCTGQLCDLSGIAGRRGFCRSGICAENGQSESGDDCGIEMESKHWHCTGANQRPELYSLFEGLSWKSAVCWREL